MPAGVGTELAFGKGVGLHRLWDVRDGSIMGNQDLVISMAPADENAQEAHQLEGRYANYFQVGHNAFEFVLDFGQYYPENVGTRFHTRIISNPAYTKALFHTLRESIERYEQMFGVIGEAE